MVEVAVERKPHHGFEHPSYDILVQCMHCGMCLPVCPTYNLTGLERSSPRGRIRLIKEVEERKIQISEIFIDEMYFCLDCQACQTVCPAGVRYGQLVESARVKIFKSSMDRGKLLKKFFFRFIFTSNFRFKLLARLLRFYQKRLRNFIYATNLIKLFPEKLRKIEPLAPKISEKFSDEILSEKISPKGEIIFRVGFLTGCFMNVMYSEVNIDTVEVLLENGCEVFIPRGQVCCGSVMAHYGDIETAKKLARKNIVAFSKDELDAIVVNSAGCGAFMKEYGELLKDDKDFAEKADNISRKVIDVSEFLVKINFKKPSGFIKKKVTYHDACHLAHTQKITREPREVIKSIPGVELVEMNESTWCCGSAGIYNIIRHDDSMKILERKIANILKTDAEIVLTANPGCHAQIEYGLRSQGIKVDVMHPVSILNLAYKISKRNLE